MSPQELADYLTQLGERELDAVRTWTDRFEVPDHVAWLIEICRVMDYHHVLQNFSKRPELKLSVPDFDIMVRGWNSSLGLLLQHTTGFTGIPMMRSTPESRGSALTFLHQLGRSVILTESAEMLRHGMAEGALIAGDIVLRMSNRVTTDHFLDRLESEKLRQLSRRLETPDPYRSLLEGTKVDNLDERMAALVFPWRNRNGTMIGYGADPDIDNYYLAAVAESTVDWRNEAGIHPDARIGSVRGADVAAVGMLMTSVYLKHIRLVDLGCRQIPDANYAMSLTIWKSGHEFVDSMSAFTGIPDGAVSAAVDLFTVRREDHGYFESEPTPFIPMLIEVSEGYLLSPVSSIFRNPFHGVRMLQERRPSSGGTVREAREGWMISDLCHLFLGNRYVVIDKPVRLRRRGRDVTDIDAAVLDRTTSTLALFQLKWQDFNLNNIKTQRSRAKNFVDRVDAWAFAVEEWLGEFGPERLCDLLGLQRLRGEQLSEIRLFAVGRIAARFQSYGYAQKCVRLAVSTWPQFVRLRHEVGPIENVICSLHSAIQADSTRPVVIRPLRHEIIVGAQRIVFENLWNLFDDGETGA